MKEKQIEVEPRIKRPLALGRRAFLLGVFHFNDFNQWKHGKMVLGDCKSSKQSLPQNQGGKKK